MMITRVMSIEMTNPLSRNFTSISRAATVRHADAERVLNAGVVLNVDLGMGLVMTGPPLGRSRPG